MQPKELSNEDKQRLSDTLKVLAESGELRFTRSKDALGEVFVTASGAKNYGISTLVLRSAG